MTKAGDVLTDLRNKDKTIDACFEPRPLSVIIPTKTLSNILPCVEAVRHHEPNARIILVDDGVDWNTLECVGLVGEEIVRRGMTVIEGVKPFVFAKNCNRGILRAGEDDVVLLNDDAILETPMGFSRMQDVAAHHSDIGLVSATTNHAGNPLQHRRPGGGWRYLNHVTPGNSFPTVAFVCVFIPRRTLGTVGWLDERFVAYGWEDNDYCRRLRKAEKRIVIDDGCFVDHSKLTSTFRGGPAIAGQLADGRQIYLDKWGSF